MLAAAQSPSGSLIAEIAAKLGAMPKAQLAKVRRDVEKATAGMAFVPSPGPQTDAFHSKADVLLYGGAGGSGKSGLLLGVALTGPRRSLVMRRHYTDLSALTEEACQFNGTRQGFNASPPPKLRTRDGRLIEFGAAANAGDEAHWQGRPHGALLIDEAAQFLESQIRFLMGWVRSTDKDKNGKPERTRTILATNPPLTTDGQWLISMFAPWLDPSYANPAKPGELRWVITDPAGADMWVDGPEPVKIDGETFEPQSRTFIPAFLRDNPFLANTDYQKKLDALPEPLRSAVRDGNFMAAREDSPSQVVPTAWILAAQQRWTPQGCRDFDMSAMAFDPAGGGKDEEVLTWRHGGWYAPPIASQGKHTAEPTSAMSAIFFNRRNGAPVVVDVGGGFGGPAVMRMKDNNVVHVKFNGADKATGRALGSRLPFANKRAEAWWRFREALDPGQEGGSIIALPPDPELRADLTAPCLDLRALEVRGELQIESKDNLRKRLGRSTGKGDVVVMALAGGAAAMRRKAAANFDRGDPAGEMGFGRPAPRVVLGHQAARRR
jgi:hypothetical protein